MASSYCTTMPTPRSPKIAGPTECHTVGAVQKSHIQPGLISVRFSYLWMLKKALKDHTFTSDDKVQEGCGMVV